jgi:hypothetical protein
VPTLFTNSIFLFPFVVAETFTSLLQIRCPSPLHQYSRNRLAQSRRRFWGIYVPTATRAIEQSFESVIKSVAAELQARGYNTEKIRMWAAEDDSVGASDPQFYVEIVVN